MTACYSQHVFKHIYQVAVNIASPKVYRHSEASNFYGRIATELFAPWKVCPYSLPAASDNFILAHFVVQETEICSTTSIVS